MIPQKKVANQPTETTTSFLRDRYTSSRVEKESIITSAIPRTSSG